MKSKRTISLDLETISPILIGIWRRFYKLSGPPDILQTREFRGVVEAVQKLRNGLETGDDLAGTDYFALPGLLGAYLLYQWNIHYQQGVSLIGELPQPPRRVLDLASGPGAFAFAALRHGAREVIAVDRSKEALQMAAEICGRYGFPLTIRSHLIKGNLPPLEGNFDLIIIGHCLDELFPPEIKGGKEAQRKWINLLLSRLTPDGSLLIVTSSLPAVNRRLLELRSELVRDGVPVQAPCVWQGECPALQAKNSPCYAQRELEKTHLISEIQRASKINLGSLKMSYLLLRNPAAGWPTLPPMPLYRVISPPIETHLGDRYYLCGTDGKKDIGCNLKEVPKEAKAFSYLKRGELFSVDNALDRGQHLDIIEGTSVKISAAVGKPLPEPEFESI